MGAFWPISLIPTAERFGHQRVLVVLIDGYACAVPYVVDGETRFLKTIYRSRALQRKYVDLSMSKPKHQKFEAPYADAEEAEIMRAVEGGEFSEDDAPVRAPRRNGRDAVQATLRKKPITIRIQEQDIAAIKALALERGIPYQTLVASILAPVCPRHVAGGCLTSPAAAGQADNPAPIAYRLTHDTNPRQRAQDADPHRRLARHRPCDGEALFDRRLAGDFLLAASLSGGLPVGCGA